MAENGDISYKFEVIVQLIKANYKLNKCIVESINNLSLNESEKFKSIEKQLSELKKEVQKTDRLLSGDYHIYTDEEIYKLKKSLSWNRLHLKTNIPLSTLQYRYKRYIKYMGGKKND